MIEIIEETEMLASPLSRMRDKQVQRKIAMMQLKLRAVQAGVGQQGRSQWVVVPGRDRRQATANALQQFPNFTVGPIRRVAGF